MSGTGIALVSRRERPIRTGPQRERLFGIVDGGQGNSSIQEEVVLCDGSCGVFC